jgi:site-specific DNA-adenine methylase
MTPWAFIEPCCGSGAVSLRLLGISRPACTWQGSKARHAETIVEIFRERGFEDKPEELWLSDPSPWGEVLPTLLNPGFRKLVIDALRRMAGEPAHEVFVRLHKQVVSKDPAERAAEFLFLQRLAHSGKAVSWRKGRWNSPGFNPTSAYGKAEVEGFGAIRPQVPAMIEHLASWPEATGDVFASGSRTTFTPLRCSPLPRRVVYIDPPYVDSTAYPDGSLGRNEVVDLALAWEEAGAIVLVSEAEPVQELLELELGWTARKIGEARSAKNPFHAKKEEWITLSPVEG